MEPPCYHGVPANEECPDCEQMNQEMEAEELRHAAELRSADQERERRVGL
jgi:hypothetical protein